MTYPKLSKQLANLAEILAFYRLEDFTFPLEELAQNHLKRPELSFPKIITTKNKTPKKPILVPIGLQSPPAKPVKKASFSPLVPKILTAQEWIAKAEKIALKSNTPLELYQELSDLTQLPLKKGAKHTCLFEGTIGKNIMIIKDAPDEKEDVDGKLFAKDSGQLLEEMLFAIGLKREDVYLANYLPWYKVPGRNLTSYEQLLLKIFLARHIVMVKPKLIVLMGSFVAKAFLPQAPWLKIIGKWQEYKGFDFPPLAINAQNSSLWPVEPIPFLPMVSPYNLLKKTSVKKKHAWENLLSLKEKMKIMDLL